MEEAQTAVPGTSDAVISLDDVIPVTYLIFGILGLAGNGLVLYVMARVRSLRTITNLFITNQSIIDFTSSIFLLAILYKPQKPDYSELGHTAWAVFLCYFWHSQYIFWSMLGCSTTNLIILTLERYIAVVYPIVYRNRVNWKTASAVAILPWITGFAIQSYWPAQHHLDHNGCYVKLASPVLQVMLGLFVFVVKLLAPVLIMFVVYYAILQRVKPRSRVNPANDSQDTGITARQATLTNNRVNTLSMAPSNTNSAEVALRDTHHTGPTVTSAQSKPDEIRNRIRMNILKTLLIVTIVFVLCWLPNQILFLVYNLGFLDTSEIPYNRTTAHKISIIIIFINIWINPIIYTFKYRRFQEGLRKTFGIPHRTNRTSSTQDESTHPTAFGNTPN